MAAGDFGPVAGLFMGLASSLHCAGVCGGIASSLLLAGSGPAAVGGRAGVLLQMQAGRVLTYLLGGAAVGGVGSALGLLLDLAGAQPLLRAAGAVALLWTGLAVAGIGPGLSVIDRIVAAPLRRLEARPGRGALPVLVGMAWGAAPCGMVYAALLNATLSGSPVAGAAFMAGFGVGTVPAVAASAYGVSLLAGRGRGLYDSRVLRLLCGLALVAVALAGLWAPVAAIPALCRGL